jgi:predicted phosphodiesterase
VKRTLVIGDVHGCAQELSDLLDALNHSSDDRVIFAGDLVARGPDSHGVVKLARKLGAEAVLGNHDAHVLKHHHGEQVGPHHVEVAASLTRKDFEFLDGLPLFIEVPKFKLRVVHAGLVPGVKLEDQRREDLINMRSLDAQGRPSRRMEEGVPWASKWPGPELVVFGHDAMRGLQDYPFALGLDTGCVYGKRLTAVVFPGKILVSVPARKQWCRIDD